MNKPLMPIAREIIQKHPTWNNSQVAEQMRKDGCTGDLIKAAGNARQHLKDKKVEPLKQVVLATKKDPSINDLIKARTFVSKIGGIVVLKSVMTFLKEIQNPDELIKYMEEYESAMETKNQ